MPAKDVKAYVIRRCVIGDALFEWYHRVKEFE
jgi:hypothetical protein